MSAPSAFKIVSLSTQSAFEANQKIVNIPLCRVCYSSTNYNSFNKPFVKFNRCMHS